MSTTLSSSSTLEEVKGAYLDSASYAADADAAKARVFMTACAMLLLLLPSRVSQGGAGDVTFDKDSIREQMKLAEGWIASHPGAAVGSGGESRYFDVRNFRE